MRKAEALTGCKAAPVCEGVVGLERQASKFKKTLLLNGVPRWSLRKHQLEGEDHSSNRRREGGPNTFVRAESPQRPLRPLSSSLPSLPADGAGRQEELGDCGAHTAAARAVGTVTALHPLPEQSQGQGAYTYELKWPSARSPAGSPSCSKKEGWITLAMQASPCHS